MSIRDNLNGNIEALKHNLSSPYNFKGSTTFAALPASGNNVNDTYYCTDKKCNYTWNGSAWKQSSIGEAEYQAQLTQLEENFNGEISNLSSEIVDLYNHSSGVQKTLETLPRDANCYQYVSGSWVIAPLEGYAYGLTDYIEVIPYSTVIISAFFRANSEFASYALYDKNKNAIHYGNTTNDNVEVDAVNNKFALDYEITIPSNAKYIRVVAWENDYLIDNPFYVKYDVFVDAVVNELQSNVIQLYEHSRLPKTLKSLPTDTNCYKYVSGAWTIFELQDNAYGLTDYIEVIPYSTVIISAFFRANSEFASYALYDKNKNAIHYGNTTNDNVEVDAVNNKFALDYEITIPSNAKYIRVVAWNNSYLANNPFYVKYDVYIDEVVSELPEKTDYDRALRMAELPKNNNYDLFVFGGQSNMMGASAYPPKDLKKCYYAYEYLYNPKRLGAEHGEFVESENSAGEWSYKNVSIAYADGNVDDKGGSKTTGYTANTYFVSAMSNMLSDDDKTEAGFDSYSESTAQTGCNFATSFAREYASYGYPSIYSVMAKGSAGIDYYLEDTIKSFFAEKYQNMITDFDSLLNNAQIKSKNFVWCQGESDSNEGMTKETYKSKLEILWSWLKTLGFERFLCVRVGYWGNQNAKEIMKAQEEFCNEHNDCYIVTRAMSYMLFKNQNTDGWFINEPTEEYTLCRDSFYGFTNQHINEKGHDLVGKRMARNVDLILNKGENPILEEENIVGI